MLSKGKKSIVQHCTQVITDKFTQTQKNLHAWPKLTKYKKADIWTNPSQSPDMSIGLTIEKQPLNGFDGRNRFLHENEVIPNVRPCKGE